MPGRPSRKPASSGGGPLSRLSWPISLAFFLVPLILLGATILRSQFAGTPQVRLIVADRYTGQPIPDVTVLADGAPVGATPDGFEPVPLTAESVAVEVSAPGYEGVRTTLARGGPSEWQIGLRPNVLTGKLTDSGTSAGIAGANVSVVAPNGSELQATTNADGVFTFDGVPEGATLRVSSADYGTSEVPIEQKTSIEMAMAPTVVTGTVLDVTGQAVPDARIAATNGTAETVSGLDGSFRLVGGTDVQEISVVAAGFTTQTLPVDASRQVSAQLQTEMVKSLYANMGVLGEPERWNAMLDLAERTEIDAIVIDVKQDTIYYDTQVPFFQSIPNMVTPVLDMQSILNDMHERNLYAIARMVVFKDPVVAAGRPDLSVMDDVTGQPWLDMNGSPWVNAFYPELWEANADLAEELILMGFDEVQYDYIRFPSDGDLTTAEFGNDYTEALRREAITGAVALGAQRVHDAGGVFSIDLFPIIALMGDDQGIGQTLQDLTPLADYVSLMIYPSHYERGNIPVDGHPNDFPAETVTYTLERSQEFMPGTIKKMRPWLQDFDYPLEGYSAYGPDRVRAQIDAAEAMGVSGWILWNAAGQFQEEALKPG
ncbi:MAG: carboxypeptidase regulatory-like domain-containing protein [Chloroflexota bacterium]|nr:carboxypeptidase regulatory-like domain-containing protein [Chloroflexota bacterium]